MPEMGFKNEWQFQRFVEELAEEYGWSCFHIPDSAYKNANIPSGFPDLLLRRRDEAGRSSLVFAELKLDDKEKSKTSEKQDEFLNDLAQHVPTFVFRPRDLEYIKSILQDGPPDAMGRIIEPSPEIVRNGPWLPPQRSLSDILNGLITRIPTLSTGESAELRRMNPEAPDGAAFWRCMASQEMLQGPDLKEWGLIAHGMAVMAHRMESFHNERIPVGRALFIGGDPDRERAFYSETRLNQLLEAREESLNALLARLFHMLAAVGQSFDWHEMAWFILNESYNEDQAEQARIKIARAYYKADYQAERRNALQSTD